MMRAMGVVGLGAICLAAGSLGGYVYRGHHDLARLNANKQIILRSHLEVWNEPDPRKAARAANALYVKTFVLHDWTGDDASGVAGVIKGVAETRADFPDWYEHPQSAMSEGDYVADRFVSTGRQARDLAPIPHIDPGVPNKGRRMRMPEMSMYRLVDGKIAEQWDFGDIWNADRQLGLFDPDAWSRTAARKTR